MKKLEFSNFLITDDKKPVLFESLSEKEKERIIKQFSNRLSEHMSDYYTYNSEEFTELN